MDNETVSEGMKFLNGYWTATEYVLIAVGVLVLLMIWPMRRWGMAFAVMILGVYITAAWYLVAVYEEMGMDLWTMLAIVLISGIVVLTLFYYFVFVRTRH